MGVVFKARHLRLNRPAAIKMTLGGKYHDPMAWARFLIEAEAVAAPRPPARRTAPWRELRPALPWGL
jgi:serine/threonine-protein kinase